MKLPGIAVIGFVFASFLFVKNDVSGQPGKRTVSDSTCIAALAERNFIFSAEQAQPQTGSTRLLSAGYTLSVRPDSIQSNLPFFGRAYAAPMNPGEGGIVFSSTKFTYTSVVKKKDRYEITIKPSEARDVVSMQLTAYPSGRATLRVVNLNRSSISFTGQFVPGSALTRKAF